MNPRRERPDRVAGVVLAGGFSTRYGDRDKALAPVEGTPMLRRVVDRVGAVADAVVVNCRSAQRDGFADALAGADADVAFALDPVPDRGPLAGLATALSCHDAPRTVVLACDMPWVEPRFLDALVGRLSPKTEAVVPRPDEHLQPAQSALGTGPALAAARAARADGAASLRALVGRLDATVLDAETIQQLDAGRSLRDVNRPPEAGE